MASNSSKSVENHPLLGTTKLRQALSKTRKVNTLINAVKRFQEESSIKIDTLPPALQLLDLHKIKRHDFLDQAAADISELVVARIRALGEHRTSESLEKLEQQLQRSFDLFSLPHFRQIVLENLKQLPKVEDRYLDSIMLDRNFYDACPLSVQQQIWLKNADLFKEAFRPLICSYLKRKEELLISTEPSKTNFFTFETTKARRQWREIGGLITFIGSYEELFLAVTTYIRELFCTTGDVMLCSLRYELIMAAHDACVESIVKADPCHDFAWCLEACMRDKHLETHQTNRLRYILDNFPKTSHEDTVDLAMIAGDVHVIHFLCSMTLKKLRDSGGAYLPRDMPSILVLVRVLSLGCCVRELALKKLVHSDVLDPIFITMFLPELTLLLVEDSIRAELMKCNIPDDLGEDFSLSNFLTKPSAKLITVLKASRLASLLWYHCCIDMIPSKKRLCDIPGLSRYAEALPLLRDNVASTGVWCHLLFHRLIHSNQFETVLLDVPLCTVFIEQVLLKNLVVDRSTKYQLLKLIGEIGHIWGHTFCLGLLKSFDEFLTLANHIDMDYFISEYNKLREKLMHNPVASMDKEQDQSLKCMSNSNLEPLPFKRPFGNASTSNSNRRTLGELAAAVSTGTDEDSFVDVSGLARVSQTVTGACRKCGYPGHLPFQCRNYIQLKPGQSTVIDISSTSSESDGETPLVRKLDEEPGKKGLKKKKKKKHKTKSHRRRDDDVHSRRKSGKRAQSRSSSRKRHNSSKRI